MDTNNFVIETFICYFWNESTCVLSSPGKSEFSVSFVCTFRNSISGGAGLSVAIEISCNQYRYLCTYFAAVFQISLTVKLHWEINSGKVSYPNLIKKNQQKQLAYDLRV